MINYDSLVDKLMESPTFQKSLSKLTETIKKNEKEAERQVSEMIDEKFAQVLEDLKIQGKAIIMDWDDDKNQDLEIRRQLEQFKSELVDLTSDEKLQLARMNQLEIEGLLDRLNTLENKWDRLLNEVQKCCGDSKLTETVLSSMIQKMRLELVSHEELKAALEEMEKTLEQNLLDLSKRSVLNMFESDHRMVTSTSNGTFNNKEKEVKDLVHSALLTYGADKTGSFDFALETAGGSVVSTRCTPMYTDR